MANAIVRVLRVIEIEGPMEWVEKTVRNSIHGEREFGPGKIVRAATLGNYPIVLPPKPDADPPVVVTGD